MPLPKCGDKNRNENTCLKKTVYSCQDLISRTCTSICLTLVHFLSKTCTSICLTLVCFLLLGIWKQYFLFKNIDFLWFSDDGRGVPCYNINTMSKQFLIPDIHLVANSNLFFGRFLKCRKLTSLLQGHFLIF